MGTECDIQKKVSNLESIGKKICSDLRNFQRERAILSREAKCLLRELEKGQAQRHCGKKKHGSATACTCAIWEKDLVRGGESDIEKSSKVQNEEEESFTCKDACNCYANLDQESCCEDPFELCKCSSCRHNEIGEPFHSAQPVTIASDDGDDDDDDDLDDDSEDDINDTHPIPSCDVCVFCKESNAKSAHLLSANHKFNVDESDTRDLIERQRGGGGHSDSESSNGRTTNLSSCTCKCDICAIRNKHGGLPPCCSRVSEQPDRSIDADSDENLQSSQTVSSEISEVHQYCKITKLREALEKLKNRNHTLRKLLKQRDYLSSSPMTQQGTCKFCPYHNDDDNNSEKDRNDCKEATRELVGILKILQSKCRTKDGMIVTLADELKECANSERFKRILVKLTNANIDCDNIDFDRCTLWKYLVSKEFHTIEQHSCTKKNIVDKKAQCGELTIGVIILSCIFLVNIHYRYRCTIMLVFRATGEALYQAYEILRKVHQCCGPRHILLSIMKNCLDFCDVVLSSFNCHQFVISLEKLTYNLTLLNDDGFLWLTVIIICAIIFILLSYRARNPLGVRCADSVQINYDTCKGCTQNEYE